MCGYFWDPWVSFVMADEFSVRVTKIYFKDWCLMNSQPTFSIFKLFKLSELWWPHYQKHVTQIILNCTTLYGLVLQIFMAFNKNKITRSFMLIYFILRLKNSIYNISLEIHLASSGKSRLSIYRYSAFTWWCWMDF